MASNDGATGTEYWFMSLNALLTVYVETTCKIENQKCTLLWQILIKVAFYNIT